MLFNNAYIKTGSSNMVAYLIKIERIKKINASNILFFIKRKKEKSAKNIITISLWLLTIVSSITSGLRAKIEVEIKFFDIFQIINTVPR